MKLNWNKVGFAALGAGLIAVACGPERLEDVGDLDGEGGGGTEGVEMVGGGDTDLGGSGNPVVVPKAGSSGDSGGTGGMVDLGQGGLPAFEDLECEACEVVVEASSNIAEVVTTEDRVYWIEAGTFDVLDNYEDNGRLSSLGFDGGEPLVIASDLQGPSRLLSVGPDYAYLFVNKSSVGSNPRQLVRVALDSGENQVVGSEDFWGWSVVVNSGIAYWTADNHIQRLAESSSEPSEPFYQGAAEIHELVGDDAQLYFTDTEGLKSLPYAGGEATLLRAFSTTLGNPNEDYEELRLFGDYIYALEIIEYDHYVVRIPKAGGAWKRVSAPQEQATRLRVDADVYFTNRASHRGSLLIQGDVASPSPGAVLVASPWSFVLSWDVAPSSVYMALENRLYSVARLP